MILVYRYRVKSLNGLLNKQKPCGELRLELLHRHAKHALKWNKKWPTGFDECADDGE